MRRRLLIVALLVPALAAPAAAAPYRMCKRLNDATGEYGGYYRPQENILPGSSADIDIDSGDLATNATHLTAVLRLVDLTPEDPTRVVQGSRWHFYFSVGREHHYVLEAYAGGTAPGFELWREPHGWEWPEGSGNGATNATWERYLVAKVTGVIDKTKNEVRWTVPLATFKSTKLTVRRGTWFWLFAGVAERSLGDFEGSPIPSVNPVTGRRMHMAAYPPFAWDIAQPAKYTEYYAGSPSCVVVGR